MHVMPGDRAGSSAAGAAVVAAQKLELWPSAPPLSGDYSWVNQGSATVTDTGAGMIMSCANAGANSAKLLVRPVPAGTPFNVYGQLQSQCADGNITCGAGIVLRDGANKFLSLGLVSVSYAIVLKLGRWTNATSYSADVAGTFAPTAFPTWLRMSNDGTTITAYYSYDGINWTTLTSDPIASFVASVTQAGMFINPNGGLARAMFSSFDFQAPN